jgi:LemA protein
MAIELDQQHRRRLTGVFIHTEGIVDGVNAGAVHHFHARGQHAGGGHQPHRLAIPAQILEIRIDAPHSRFQRRLDLIPNLVETVRGYANFEKSALEAVITARQGALSAPATPVAQAGADNALTGALRQLFALSEAYPDLKANQNFLALQEELTATEGRVAYARQFYNDEVLRYDNAIEKFPGLIFARIFGFGPKEYFEAEAAAGDAPKVQF